jgi:hypothetical protein
VLGIELNVIVEDEPFPVAEAIDSKEAVLILLPLIELAIIPRIGIRIDLQ